MTDPDDDYENPVGEMLDEETIQNLQLSDLVSKLGDIVSVIPAMISEVVEAVIDAWPFT